MANQGSSRDDPLQFYIYSIPESKQDAFRTEVRRTATAAVRDFPSQLNALIATLRRVDCTSALASFSYYGLPTTIDEHGQRKEIMPDIVQHHAELLQAIALTIEPTDWGGIPTTHDLGIVFELIKVLADAPPMKYLTTDIRKGSQSLAVEELLVRKRLTTQVVRNWDYHPQTIAGSKALYGALEKGLKRTLGFDVIELIVLAEAIASQVTLRQGDHMRMLATVLGAASTPLEQLERYYEHNPSFTGSPKSVLEALSSRSVDVKTFVRSHSDLRLPNIYTFDVPALASSSGLSAETVEAMVSTLSLDPGALAGCKPEHLYLDNPIWSKPFIGLGHGQFLIPVIQAIFSHLHLIAKRLSDEAGMVIQLDKRRSDYLEAEVVDVLTATGARVSKNAKWKWRGATYETDCLALLDRTLLIVEAKSSRLTHEVLRAARGSFKDLIRRVVLKPSEQSARLLSVVKGAREDDAEAVAVCRALDLDAHDIDLVIRLSITLDDLSFICTAELALKEAQWIPPEHDLPTTMAIHDFRHVLDILSNPVMLCHYLHERSFLQRSATLLADELDLLGFYLRTGLNVGQVPPEHFLALTGESKEIDEYYTACESGMAVGKPNPKLRPLFRGIVEKLTATRPPGWLTMGRHVLSCADSAQQEDVERQLRKLRKVARHSRRQRKSQSWIVIQPEEVRKAVVLFFLFPKSMHKVSIDRARRLGVDIQKGAGSKECCVVVKSIDDTRSPYEEIFLVGRGAQGSP